MIFIAVLSNRARGLCLGMRNGLGTAISLLLGVRVAVFCTFSRVHKK
jgi:hypothetical protein